MHVNVMRNAHSELSKGEMLSQSLPPSRVLHSDAERPPALDNPFQFTHYAHSRGDTLLHIKQQKHCGKEFYL